MKTSSYSSILSKSLLLTAIALQINAGCAFADEAEERQRDPIHLKTMDLQKHGMDQTGRLALPYQEVIKQEALGNQRLKAMAQGLDPKTSEIAANKTIGSAIPDNVFVVLYFTKQMEAPKEFSLGPNGFLGANAFVGQSNSQTTGFFENASSSIVNFSRKLMNYLK